MKVGKKTSKYFALISSFILLGFFVSILHLSPEIHHQGDSHAEHQVLVDGVDHQPSLIPTHSNIIQIAILPQTNLIPELTANINSVFISHTDLYAPPNKIPLYIKNNTFLI